MKKKHRYVKTNSNIIELPWIRKENLVEPYDMNVDRARVHLEYAVEIYPFIDPVTNNAYDIPMIVLRDRRTNIVFLHTGLERYITPSGKISSNKSTLSYIVQMLNYIMIENYPKYQIKNIDYLTYESIQDFLDYYSSEPYIRGQVNLSLPQRRSPDTVDKAVRIVARFCENLKNKGSTKNLYMDFFVDKPVRNGTPRKEPVFRVVRYEQEIKDRTQDLPDKVVFRMIELAKQYDPGLVLALAIALFGGLREGEIVNVFRTHGKLKINGIRFDRRKKIVKINLKTKVPLSKARRVTGVTKRLRTQEIFPHFVPLFEELFEEHMAFLKKIGRETDPAYAPLFYNKQKRNGIYGPMTYKGYIRRWKRIFRLVIKECLSSDDDKMQSFGSIAMTEKFTPHSFRYWYSTYVALHTISAQELQEWRGDKCVESAQTYIRYREAIHGRVRIVTDEVSKETMKLINSIKRGI